MRSESDKPDGDVWEDLEFPSNERGDDGAEVVVIPGGRVEMLPLGGGRRAGLSIKRFLSLLRFSNSLRRLRPYQGGTGPGIPYRYPVS